MELLICFIKRIIRTQPNSIRFGSRVDFVSVHTPFTKCQMLPIRIQMMAGFMADATRLRTIQNNTKPHKLASILPSLFKCELRHTIDTIDGVVCNNVPNPIPARLLCAHVKYCVGVPRCVKLTDSSARRCRPNLCQNLMDFSRVFPFRANTRLESDI